MLGKLKSMVTCNTIVGCMTGSVAADVEGASGTRCPDIGDWSLETNAGGDTCISDTCER